MNSPAQIIATAYLHDFTDKIRQCKNIEEYYELIGGVFVFSELVQLHFKELYEMDASNADRVLLEIRTAAKIAAESIASNIIKEPSSQMN